MSPLVFLHGVGGHAAWDAQVAHFSRLGYPCPAWDQPGYCWMKGQTMAQVAARLMPAMRGTRSDPAGVARSAKIMSGISAATYRKAVQLLMTFDRRADLERIAAPTPLVAGSDDKTAPPALMARMGEKIRGSEYVVLEGCGHLGPMDQPRAFNATLERFLRKNGI